MKVLLVNGSGHENGCTYTALMEAAKVLEAEGIFCEIFQLGTKPIRDCTACGGCGRLQKNAWTGPSTPAAACSPTSPASWWSAPGGPAPPPLWTR